MDNWVTNYVLGSVSDSLRNLIVHHADTRTFVRYYLSRRINKNLPVIIRGLNPEDDIMRAACWTSRTIDPNRPQELTTAQSSSVNQQPEIVDLVRQRDGLGRQMGRPLSKHEGTEEYANAIYKKLNQEIAGARQRARDALTRCAHEMRSFLRSNDQEQPMREIQRQQSEVKLAVRAGAEFTIRSQPKRHKSMTGGSSISDTG
jgi:seryl-tRNA synthetase